MYGVRCTVRALGMVTVEDNKGGTYLQLVDAAVAANKRQLQITAIITVENKKCKVRPTQGLKYNFQGGGTVQLSANPQFVPGPWKFISWASVSIAVSQIIDDQLNVLNMILCFFSFCKIL